jgi:hypothetical protein
MLIRQGKFGPFWACPKSYKGNDHGTVKTDGRLAENIFDIEDEKVLDQLYELDGY